MKTVKPIFYLVTFFLAFSLFTDLTNAEGPTRLAARTITEPTTWTKENSPYILSGWNIIAAPLTIEEGTLIKFNRGSLERLIIQDDFIVKGTKEKPVVFTSMRDDEHGGDTNGDGGAHKPSIGDWHYISISPSDDVKIRIEHAQFFYSYLAVQIQASNQQNREIMVKNCEFKKNGTALKYLGNAKFVIDSNIISDNTRGITFESGETSVAVNNVILENDTGVIATNSSDPDIPALDARYNWWGDESGPYNEDENPDGEGNPVTGQLTFDPWLEEDPIENPDPVIIIPGIMGSATKYPGGVGELKIDPILHTYDNLIASLEKNGYEKEEKLFEFPYEWRDSNILTAQELKEKISEVKNQTGRPKVDIVAHSMGGLIARYYIEGESYENDIDQLITLGTPHKGAPKSYLTWEAGEIGTAFDDNIVESMFKIEAKHSGFDNLKDYIQGRVISVKELLPDYDYLRESSSGEMRNYPNDYPRNTFLDFLNGSGRLNRLNNIDFTNIISDTERNNTIEKLRVAESDTDGIWKHGMPENYYDDSTDQGIEYGPGDETVPFSSAKGIASNKEIILNSSHGDLPTAAQCHVFTELSGNQDCSAANIFDRVVDILTFGVFSPADIQIESPSGRKIGKNFETGEEVNEIEGAYYTGSDTENEFVTIPNSENGKYKILVQGTGEGGSYTIETTKITENPNDLGNAIESSTEIAGESQAGVVQEFEIEVADDQVLYNPDTEPPMITIFSPEETSYTNDRTLMIDYKIEDFESRISIESWQVKKNGEALDWMEKSIDLSLERLGEYTLKISATDEAGNSAEKEANFQVGTDISAIRKNFDHYHKLGLIKKTVAYKYFRKKLKTLENLFKLLRKIEDSSLKPKLKQKSVAVLSKIINADIDVIVHQIKKKSPRWVNEKAADLIVESLSAIRIK